MVYGPRSLLDSCRQREDVSTGLSEERLLLPQHRLPKPERLPRVRSSVGAHLACTQRLNQKHFRHHPQQTQPRRPSEEHQRQRQVQRLDDEQLQQNQQQGQHLQNGQSQNQSSALRGVVPSCPSRIRPETETGKPAAGPESNSPKSSPHLPSPPPLQDSHTVFRNLSSPHSYSFGSDGLLRSKSGLIRAGLYWFLASSVSSIPGLSEWYLPLGTIGSLPAITGKYCLGNSTKCNVRIYL